MLGLRGISVSELHHRVPLPGETPGPTAGSIDYYFKAAQWERAAAAAPSDRMRDLCLEMAAQWRRLGDIVTA
jgi:hypothetical protein